MNRKALVLPAHFYPDEASDIDYEGMGITPPEDYQVKDIYIYGVGAVLPRPKDEKTCILYAIGADDNFIIDLTIEETLKRIDDWIDGK